MYSKIGIYSKIEVIYEFWSAEKKSNYNINFRRKSIPKSRFYCTRKIEKVNSREPVCVGTVLGKIFGYVFNFAN